MASRHDRAILNSIFNPLLPVGECIYDDISGGLQDEEEITDTVREAKDLEIEGVKEAELGNFNKSLEIFTKAIQLAPNRASGYNNRAQALRLMGDITGAMQDLNNAINLSEGHGKAACLAYCQRAVIHRLHEDDTNAREDFTKAAQLGSEYAKAQLVQMNPYAALCNQMLSQVISKLQKGEIVE